MPPELITSILSYGPAGVAILVLLLVSKRLFDLLTAEQSAHRQTAVTAAENSHKFADALENTNEIVKTVVEKLDKTNEKVDKTNESVGRLEGTIRERIPPKGGS